MEYASILERKILTQLQLSGIIIRGSYCLPEVDSRAEPAFA